MQQVACSNAVLTEIVDGTRDTTQADVPTDAKKYFARRSGNRPTDRCWGLGYRGGAAVQRCSAGQVGRPGCRCDAMQMQMEMEDADADCGCGCVGVGCTFGAGRGRKYQKGGVEARTRSHVLSRTLANILYTPATLTLTLATGGRGSRRPWAGEQAGRIGRAGKRYVEGTRGRKGQRKNDGMFEIGRSR